MTTSDRLERYRRRYAARTPGWTPATARYQGWVADRLTPSARVLDLGCGRGGIVERLGTTGRWVGVDPDRASLREHRAPALPRLQGVADGLPFAGATFDIVACSWVLEHLADPRQAFAEVARVLRPGGTFLLLTPNARHPIPRLSRWLARLSALQARIVPRLYGRAAADAFPVHYRANTPTQIDRLAGETGLRLARMELVEDPAYFAWNRPTFALAQCLEALLPALWKVHIIAEYTRPLSEEVAHDHR